MSLLKYFGEPGGPGTVHPDAIQWPGTPSGFPLLGPPAPALRDSEYTETPLHQFYHAELFRLWMEDDHARFIDIMDRVTNQLFKLYVRENHWDPDNLGYIVWLEWTQIYGQNPPDRLTRNVPHVANSGPRFPAVDPYARTPVSEIPLVDGEDALPDGAPV